MKRQHRPRIKLSDDERKTLQVCQIIAIACERPEDYDRPITHWTHKELAEVVIKEGIVDSISPSYLGTLLKKTTYNPKGKRGILESMPK